MNSRVFSNGLVVSLLVSLTAVGFLAAQTELKPGFNLFSPQQDVEIGQKSAAEVEKQFPLLRDQGIQKYVAAIGDRLARQTQGPDFPYQFKVVNVADVNAFALPGGFMYIHRGLIEAANEEAELAGVMAHEIAHVALRHGTNQASKAYLAQAGLGVLGAVLGGGGTGGSTAQIIGAVGGFGLNATFMKFSRDAEKQADLMGAQILARAGYNPMAMAGFFEELRELQGRDPSKMEIFFSDHPAPTDRAEYVAEETRTLRVQQQRPVGNFSSIQSTLKRIPKAPSMKELAEGKTSPSGPPTPADDRRGGRSIEPPAAQMQGFESRESVYRIWHPRNWNAVEASQGVGVTIISDQGMVESAGQPHIVFGAIANRFEGSNQSRTNFSGPFRGRNQLELKTNELVAELLQGNQYLSVVENSARSGRLDGGSALTLRLSGRSPATRERESVALYSRLLSDGQLFYCLFISPEDNLRELQPTFDRMLLSIRIEP